MILNKLKTRNRSERTGALTVEFALVLPLLLLCLFAFYEISRASMIKHATEASAYEGARKGIVPGATEQEIRDQVEFVLSSVGVENFTINVEQNHPSGSTLKVKVTVNVPFTETTTGGLLFGANRSFTAVTELGQETL
ncbi:TadE/TadG family type IV pilus assembly protein [Mariniblastus fucicola]|uniref:TadE-like protein n=1 Tax=Mariniblastus fucicola TaxID=980251 RepID=A0A5B9P6D6_9BACT|nr:TadE/TadG family type IV pilus assembly protein [Mariniblastus fucicola]QEG21834.1 TadE-like protein [Mariniblastus fucicola]